MYRQPACLCAHWVAYQRSSNSYCCALAYRVVLHFHFPGYFMHTPCTILCKTGFHPKNPIYLSFSKTLIQIYSKWKNILKASNLIKTKYISTENIARSYMCRRKKMNERGKMIFISHIPPLLFKELAHYIFN